MGDKKRKRVFSGMRPTGRLHLGHYFGALQNWVKLQNEYDCFFCVVDWHALTTHYEDTSSIAENTLQVATDWLAVGLDPAKATLFIQSSVLEHAELHLLLSMITPLGWLERVPTYKEQIENLKDRDLGTYGFLGYPLLQTADIVLYDGELVPVGEDQVPHIELAREIARKFNTHFSFAAKPELFAPANRDWLGGVRKDLFGVLLPLATDSTAGLTAERVRELEARLRLEALGIGVQNFFAKVRKAKRFFKVTRLLSEPEAMLTETPRLPGTDGTADGKELRQRHLAFRPAGRDSHESAQHDDRPAARPAHRSWAAGSVSRVRVSQTVLDAGDHCASGPRVPHRGDRLRGLQEAHGGRAGEMDRAYSDTTQEI